MTYHIRQQATARMRFAFWAGRADLDDRMAFLTVADHSSLSAEGEIRISEIKLAQMLRLSSVHGVHKVIDTGHKSLQQYGPVIRLPQLEPLKSKSRPLAWLNKTQAMIVLQNVWIEWGGKKRRPGALAEAKKLTHAAFAYYEAKTIFFRNHHSQFK